MKQVLCYELVCPICSTISYQVDLPEDTHTVCSECKNERTYLKGFTQDELELISALPPLTGTRKQLIWAHRLRLNEVVRSGPLAEQIETQLDAKYWIDNLVGRAK